MNYFINTHQCCADMYLNLSLYHLKVIGNYCQAIYYFRRATEIKLSLKEYYSLIRLNFQISKALIEKLKPSNEQCLELEHLDISQYFKYDALSKNFLDEMNSDVNLSLDFWKHFREPLKEKDKKIDFNKIFKLTDKIRISKIKIENIWNDLLKIYGGVNDYFQLYMDYIEQINDDGLKKRDLESLKRKNDNYMDFLNNNYYSILFSKETGIIIANGDKGNEGIIQLANNEIENIFKYKPIDLKGVNLTNLMPKIFAINHSKYIERYFRVGQKKL
jgi:PAS domain-containing protein